MSGPESERRELHGMKEMAHVSSMLIQGLFRSYRTKQLEHSGVIAYSNKADGSVVTELDEEIERAVQAEIRAKFRTFLCTAKRLAMAIRAPRRFG